MTRERGGALGNVAPNREEGEANNPPEQERDPPADKRAEDGLVEQQDREGAAHRGPDPVAAADRERHLPPKPRRYELVHRRVDGRVFPADASPRYKAEDGQDPEVRREGCK